MTILIFGGKGWIGSQFVTEWNKCGGSVILSSNRADDTSNVEKELEELSVTNVVCMVGRTHGPGCNTIDWLEDGRDKVAINVKDNLFAPVSLALLCRNKGIHFTYLGTGCIFSGYDQTYGENDLPDFFGSGYSIVKGFTDRLMHQLNVLNLRIRMPIVAEDNERDFVTKICSYEKVIDRKNSMTVLPDFIPLFVKLIQDKVTGTINCVNPGSISHTEVLNLYKEIVDNSFTYKLMTLDEQDKMLKSERSNNVLQTDVVETFYRTYFHEELPTINESIRRMLRNRIKLQ